MFGSIGVFELMIIAAVALMVLGPEKFPEFAKMAARFVKDIRSYANEIQREVAKEIKPMTKELGDLRRIDPEKYLDKLAGDDEDEKLKNTPPNPEPHPTEMGFGPAPTEPAAETSNPAEEKPSTDAGASAGPSPVVYGDKGSVDTYPQEDDPEKASIPPTASRLDG
jgi:Tat protein translocase TatB subunit